MAWEALNCTYLDVWCFILSCSALKVLELDQGLDGDVGTLWHYFSRLLDTLPGPKWEKPSRESLPLQWVRGHLPFASVVSCVFSLKPS